MTEKIAHNTLNRLYKNTKSFDITEDDKIIIFSDLHMGGGNGSDDFLKNADIFEHILKNHYLPEGYKLVLNGDIEELYKFNYNQVEKQWKHIYDIFSEFQSDGHLFKIVGNHDYEIMLNKKINPGINLYDSIIFNYKGNEIFIYHGHQTANFIEQYNMFAMFFVRYFVMALSIKNPTKPIGQHMRFKTEKIAYDFARKNKIISILGHTHRALFESLSKIDNLKISIENIIRKYPKLSEKAKGKAAKQIGKFKAELEKLYAGGRELNLKNSIYNDALLVPCLFNSGSCISQNGLTGIEISGGKIALVYWFDINKSKKYTKKNYIKYKAVKTTQFEDSNYYRTTLKEQSLEYIFTRIKLLA